VKVQGLVVPEQWLPPDQPVKRLPEAGVTVSVTESPIPVRQEVTFLQLASGLLSVSETVPLPLPLVFTATVAVLTKLAVSVSVFVALKVQGLLVPEHVPPDQPLKRLPLLGDSLIEIESPVKTLQLVLPEQPT